MTFRPRFTASAPCFNDASLSLVAELDIGAPVTETTRRAMVDWAEAVRASLVMLSPAGASGRARLPGPDGPNGEITSALVQTPTDGDNWSADAWRAFGDRFATGGTRELELVASGYAAAVASSIWAQVLPSRRAAVARFALTIEFPPLDGHVPGWVQSTLLGLWSSGAMTLAAATGHITLDHVSDLTAHELDRGIRPDVRTLDRQVRGYHWATLLGPGHLAALGGASRVAREAPVAEVRELGSGDRARLILLLTEDVNEVADAQLAALKRYLAPILTVAPVRHDCCLGPAVRSIPDDRSVPRIEIRGHPELAVRLIARSMASLPVRDEAEPWQALEDELGVEVRGRPDQEGLTFAFSLLREPSEEELRALEALLEQLLRRYSTSETDHISFVSPVRRSERSGIGEVVEWWVDATHLRARTLRRLVRDVTTFGDTADSPYRSLILGRDDNL